MGAAAVVPAVIGGAQAIGQVSKASKERKQIKAQNEAQKAQVEAQKKQIEIQKNASIEQAQLALMDIEQNRMFSEYQTQLGKLQRQTAYQQQTAQLAAQGQMEQLEAQQATLGNETQRLGALIEGASGRLNNDMGLAGTQQELLGQRQAAEGQRFQSLLGAGNADLQSGTQQYGTLLGLNQQGMENDAQQYGALLQGTDAMFGANNQRLDAEVQRANQLSSAAQNARGTFNELSGAEQQLSQNMEQGSRRLSAMDAMYAAAGLAPGGRTNSALSGELSNDINQLAIDQRMTTNGVGDETVQTMLQQGRIAELSRLMGYEQAGRTDRQALDSMSLANLQAGFNNQNLGMQADYANRLGDAERQSADFSRQFANLTADQQQQLLNDKGAFAQAQNSFQNGQLTFGEMQAMLQADQAGGDILRQLQMNSSARNTTQEQLNASMRLDDRTDNINRLMTDVGFNIQEGGIKSQEKSSVKSAEAQKKGATFVPQQAPSLLGSVLSAGLNGYTTYKSAAANVAQSQRAADIQTGNIPYRTSGLMSPSYDSSAYNYAGNPMLLNNPRIDDNYRLPSLLGRY